MRDGTLMGCCHTCWFGADPRCYPSHTAAQTLPRPNTSPTSIYSLRLRKQKTERAWCQSWPPPRHFKDVQNPYGHYGAPLPHTHQQLPLEPGLTPTTPVPEGRLILSEWGCEGEGTILNTHFFTEMIYCSNKRTAQRPKQAGCTLYLLQQKEGRTENNTGKCVPRVRHHWNQTHWIYWTVWHFSLCVVT